MSLKKSLFQNFSEENWEQLTVSGAFAKFTNSDCQSANETSEFDYLLVDQIEPKLGAIQPCFLIDYPIEQASLAKSKDSDPKFAERFELYFKGIELANGFSELLDPKVQRARFNKERDLSPILAEMPMPEAFLSDLGKIEKAGGIALGLDRFVMFLLELESVDQVVAFSPEDL